MMRGLRAQLLLLMMMVVVSFVAGVLSVLLRGEIMQKLAATFGMQA